LNLNYFKKDNAPEDIVIYLIGNKSDLVSVNPYSRSVETSVGEKISSIKKIEF